MATTTPMTPTTTTTPTTPTTTTTPTATTAAAPPANESKMTGYQTQTEIIAATIKTKLNFIEAAHQDEIAIDDRLQAIKSELLVKVNTERFEINQKLKYTNDDQRRAALLLEIENHSDYHNLNSTRSVKIVEQSIAKSEVEYQRRKLRAVELMMLFYANH